MDYIKVVIWYANQVRQYPQQNHVVADDLSFHDIVENIDESGNF